MAPLLTAVGLEGTGNGTSCRFSAPLCSPQEERLGVPYHPQPPPAIELPALLICPLPRETQETLLQENSSACPGGTCDDPRNQARGCVGRVRKHLLQT